MQKLFAILIVTFCSLQVAAQQNTMVFTEFDSLKTGKLIFTDSTELTTAPILIWSKTDTTAYFTGGSVGIGTSAPTSPLEVSGQIKSDSILLEKIKINGGVSIGDGIGDLHTTSVAIGTGALSSSNDLRDNVAVGNQSLESLTSGRRNFGLGSRSLFRLENGQNNIAIGYLSAASLKVGDSNIILGSSSSPADSVNNIIAIGAGVGPLAGSNNGIFIGGGAGRFESSPSHKLYIENSNSTTPLIFGQFDTDQLGINTTAVGDYTLAVGGNTQTDTLHADVIAIDTTYVPVGYSLAVNGDVIAEQVDVVLSGSWPDYVFDEGYNLMSLEETADYIGANNHLPGVQSQSEMEEEGKIDLAAMNLKLLEKVEELTLHLIQQNERLNKLETQNEKLSDRLEELENE